MDTTIERSSAEGRRSAEGRSSVEQCTDLIRQLIMTGALLPGQPIRQDEIASRLGFSRIPAREALKHLQADGVVTQRRNVGYRVARFSVQELDQIYLIRRCLESELLNKQHPLLDEEVSVLEDVNQRFANALTLADIPAASSLNRQFHFYFFQRAGLEIVSEEVTKMWDRSEFYRSLYLYHPEAPRLVVEHQGLIEAASAGDIHRLIFLMNEHRETTRQHLSRILTHDGKRSEGEPPDGQHPNTDPTF